MRCLALVVAATATAPLAAGESLSAGVLQRLRAYGLSEQMGLQGADSGSEFASEAVDVDRFKDELLVVDTEPTDFNPDAGGDDDGGDDTGDLGQSVVVTSEEERRALVLTNAPMFTTVYRSNTSPKTVVVEKEGFSAFGAEVTLKFNSGWKLTEINCRADASALYLAGVFEQSAEGLYWFYYSSWTSFTNKWTELSGAGYRLKDIEVCKLGSTTYFIGVYRPGNTAHYLWLDAWSGFVAKWQANAASNLRLNAIDTFMDGATRKYVGVWGPGTDGYYMDAGDTFASFTSKYSSRSAAGFRLIDVKRYLDGTTYKFFSIYRQGTDGTFLWINTDWQNTKSRIASNKANGLHLISLESNPGTCSVVCANHVLGGEYNYYVTNHAWYYWPTDGTPENNVRLTALHWQGDSPKFHLPFSATNVKQGSGWQYSSKTNGEYDYHYATGDYSNGDEFELKAPQAGVVLFVGWDNWSGNTVVISHKSDTWRTIFMHMRNDPQQDCLLGAGTTYPWLKAGDSKDAYKCYLDNTKCWAYYQNNVAPRPQPDSGYWGDSSMKIKVKQGDVVSIGQSIGFAGNTGPGGKRCNKDPNTGNWVLGGNNIHLHFFTAYKDPTDGKFYFVDLYGVYGTTSCYPSTVTGKFTACSRYPVAWEVSPTGGAMYP